MEGPALTQYYSQPDNSGLPRHACTDGSRGELRCLFDYGGAYAKYECLRCGERGYMHPYEDESVCRLTDQPCMFNL